MNRTITPNKISFQKRHFFVFFATILFTLISHCGFAQVNTYGFSETVSTYSPLATSTPAYTAPWDDHVSGSAFLAPLNFNFVYDGVNQTQCYISPNGFISFGIQPASNVYLPLSIAASFTNGGTISALGMDLISASSSATNNIVFNTSGTAPNRVFVVQWTNAKRKSAVGNFNFQIRLNETTNTIEFSYGVCSGDTTVLNAQVGIRGVTNDFVQGDINNRFQTGTNVNFTWSGKTVSGTANSNTVRTSNTEYPNNGLKYTYTPSTSCSTPTGVPSALVVGTTSVSPTSFVGNSFTGGTPAPTNYLILRSTVNTPPSAANIPNRFYWAVNDIVSGVYTVISTSNATSFTQTGLTPNTTYYYWAIPYNAGCLGGPFYKLSSIITASKTTCISEPLGVITSGAAGNSFIASWNAVTGATDYNVDVSTTNTFSTTLPAYTGASSAGATTLTITGLSPLTTYYFRVRSVGISCNVNSLIGTAATLCGSYPIPYFQNFDSTPVATLPTCFTVVDGNSDTVSWKVQNSIAASTPNAYHLATNTATDSDDWFFIPGLNLTGGVTYRLKFKYNTNSASIYNENLRIKLGSSASVAGMNLVISDLPNIVNTVYQTQIVDFTPTINDVYYIGFQGYSTAGQSKIYIDDISVIVSPTCFEPINVSVTSVGSTATTITWDEPSPAPANGYNYFVSTSNALPSDTVTPTGSVGAGITTATIPGLTAATLYYVWVRGNCSPTDHSVWSLFASFSTDCSAPALLTVTNGTLCGGGSTTLKATGSSGSTIEWYNDSIGTTLLSTGNNFVTPNLFISTTYYAQSITPGGLIIVGPASPIAQGGSQGIQPVVTEVKFTVNIATTLQSFDIFPLVSGQNGVLTIRDNLSNIIATYPYVTNVAGGNTAQTISIGLNLTVGNYLLYMDTLPTSGIITNLNGASYPISSSVADLTGNNYDNTFYLYAYNWKFSNICRSQFTPVIANVTTAPVISLSQTTATICSGEITPLVTLTGSSSYNTFVWSPSTNITGSVAAGFTFKPTITTTYNLTASQSSGSLCQSVVSIAVTVNAEPSAITVVPSTTTICQGVVQPLNATLAVATPITIYSEDFNGATNNWTTTNLSVGGNTAAADWTLRPLDYIYSSGTWKVKVRSNDSSQCYFSNSDAQGSPGSNTTLSYLTSPDINLVGYTTATLSFWHYLRYIPTNIARVEATTDNGATWTTILNYESPQGTAPLPSPTLTNFVNATADISSLIGNPSVKFRFYYYATWDYGWAIDNFKITGKLALEVNWSPITDLYFDSSAMTQYIAGTPASTIYAKPNSTITYKGTALGSNGCSTSSTGTITVLPNITVGTLSSSQSVCATWGPNPLTLTGSIGSIVKWEYATNATFTAGLTPIANTTTTLTAAQIGTYSGDRYFRVVLQNGSCPAVYSNSVVVSFYSTTWNGLTWLNGVPTSSTKAVFAGDYSSTGDLQACSAEILSGNVVFNTGHTLTLENDVKVSGGTLTFDNNSSLVQVNPLNYSGLPYSNVGNITYKRANAPMFKFDYTYWSTPVSPQILLNISPYSPSNLFLQFNSATNAWQYIASPSTTTMVVGKGYICRAPVYFPVAAPGTPGVYISSFTGVPNTGTITIPVVGGASQFNLFGNPYPSALSANAFLLDSANAATLGGTIYLWTHNTGLNAALQYTGSDYAVYNYLGGIVGGVATTAATTPGLNTAIPNGKIASGQGFFIKGLSNGTATFKNSMRISGNNDQFFKMSAPYASSATSEPEKHRYWLNISNNQGAFKQVLLGYAQDATLGLDRLFDGELVDVGNAVTIYSFVDNTKLSIQGRPLPFDTADTIPLGYKSTISSTYSISMFEHDGIFTSQHVYLEDKVLNVIHDLDESPYTFTTEVGTFDNRFILRYKTATLGIDNPIFTENSVIVFKKPEGLFINSGNVNMKSVSVFDISGRVLATKNRINSSTALFTTLPTTEQVLLVKIEGENGEMVTKKIVY